MSARDYVLGVANLTGWPEHYKEKLSAYLDEHRAEVLREYMGALREEAAQRGMAKVTLFKPSGKYYTEEEWRIPTQEQIDAAAPPRHPRPGEGHGMIRVSFPFVPHCMRYSPDFRRIGGGAVLVETQEPWGYPHLITAEGEER